MLKLTQKESKINIDRFIFFNLTDYITNFKQKNNDINLLWLDELILNSIGTLVFKLMLSSATRTENNFLLIVRWDFDLNAALTIDERIIVQFHY
ncbi:MAG: hypothetical protein IH784_09115 [Bacteroidetes bacterium]|nr:hypothetical protein [Bacteroidota bacterium]